MTDKERAAMQQALEALEEWKIDVEFEGDIFYAQPAITALREALDHSANADKMVLDDPHPPHRLCECTACLEYWTPKPTCDHIAGGGKVILPAKAAQQPIFWTRKLFGEDREFCEEPFTTDWTPLYATPVQQVDLTDDEIAKAIGLDDLDLVTIGELEDARAVIAADREKNK